jgi:hypothetical protein
MATNPPITIGELTDVPAPGSGVGSAYHQEVTNRITHRLATKAALDAWAAANGSMAFTIDKQRLWLRSGGAWKLVGGAVPRVTARKDAAQALAAATVTTVGWELEDYDTDALHDNATQNSRLLINIAGFWQLTYTLYSASVGSTGNLQAWIGFNAGGERYAFGNNTVISGGDATINGTAVLNATATGYVEMSAYSTVARNIGGAGSKFHASYLGPI